VAGSLRGALWGLLAVQLLFGLFPIAVKKVDLEPLHVLAVRVGGAALLLGILHAWLVKNAVPIRKEARRMALLTLLGVVLNMGLFLIGLAYTTAVEAVLIITTTPVFTYALAVLMKKEVLGPRRALGIALAMAGVILLVVGSFAAQPDRPLRAFGDLLILVNALCFSAYLVLGKPMMDRYDPLSVTMWMFALGAILIVPYGLLTGITDSLFAQSGEALAWLAFIVVGPSVLTYLLNARALRHVPASTVAAFTYVQPVFAAVAAFLILGDQLEWRILPSAALVFAGLWLVARRKPRILEGQVVGE
jgi:drug/metabolite transporter (DMT)-like permease